MAPMPAGRARAYHASDEALAVNEFFAPQRTATAQLPDAEQFLRNLTVGVIEVLAGMRNVDQLARWLTEDAFRTLVTRANLAARARSARGIPAARPVHQILSIHQCSPADGVVEGTLIVQVPTRVRAVAVRVEGVDGRWRATSLGLL